MLATTTALKGIRVLEFGGLAPAPFCGMILADHGADVIRVDRTVGKSTDFLGRGKKSIVVDLKSAEGKQIIYKLCSHSDVLIEPFRPGVMERLGLGPQQVLTHNQQLIYTRMSGYGQTGPHALKAGHDINYIARNGLLSLFGRSGQHPTPPVNFAADFAGGGLMGAMGIMAALLKRGHTGKGSIIDANLTEGSAYVGTWMYSSQNHVHRSGVPIWGQPRGENYLDTGNCFYNTYETKDGRFISIGATDTHLQKKILDVIGLGSDWFVRSQSELRSKLEQIFLIRTRNEWEQMFRKEDICAEPVFDLNEAFVDPHHVARGAFVPGPNGTTVPQVAPRIMDFEQELGQEHSDPLSSSPPEEPTCGQQTDEILENLSYSHEEIEEFRRNNIVQ